MYQNVKLFDNYPKLTHNPEKNKKFKLGCIFNEVQQKNCEAYEF